ncbi:MAG: hypothetical protein M3450_18895, partial [Actinomycetota bacterium]|nr:hypothetical protein [Actinomycetota bacterium]
MTREPIASLLETPSLLDDASGADLLYTWHDLSATRGPFGRGFLHTGSFEPSSNGAAGRIHRVRPIDSESRSRWRLQPLNRRTTFNAAYSLAQRASP